MEYHSVFSKAYSYRQREGKHNLENYLTEIFSHCLKNDREFQIGFLKLIEINEPIERVKTQISYPEGIPDIEIYTSTLHIIIECKINSDLGENQLYRYTKIFKYSNKKPLLVYISKYHTDIPNFNVLKLRWFEIRSIINARCDLISQQLKIFLKEKQIAMENNFTTTDIATIQNINSVISKMDEVFDVIKKDFVDSFGPLDPSPRSTRMQKNKDGYYNHVNGSYELGVVISVGFFWWSDGEEEIINNIYSGLCIEIYANSPISKLNLLRKGLNGWKETSWESEGILYFGKYMNIQEVAQSTDANNQAGILAESILDAIQELKHFTDQNPEFFTKKDN